MACEGQNVSERAKITLQTCSKMGAALLVLLVL